MAAVVIRTVWVTQAVHMRQTGDVDCEGERRRRGQCGKLVCTPKFKMLRATIRVDMISPAIACLG